jgi:2-C-methyl-D-erythritol 2,4-cyclodiphosphate synthase
MVRSGTGYDIHRLEAGRELWIGGVHIPFKKGLLGHSDADILLHAITDALLGSLALGDIGSHFPDSDDRWKDAESVLFLREAHRLVEEAGFRICNIDATVIIERPRLSPHMEAIRGNISRQLSLPVDAVSVKATTSEGMGFIGRGEGAAARAICTISDETP